jgi:hypothetical protein
MTAPTSTDALRGAAFAGALLRWLNARFAPNGPLITAHTPLFAGGVLNSMRILDLIAWTERAAGREIADAQIRTDNFRTVTRITETFASDTEDADVAR